MSRKNSNHKQTPVHVVEPAPAALAVEEEKTVPVELTADQIKLLMQLVKKSPVQGNMETLPTVLGRLASLQEQLVASLKKFE
jgi:hypothetical protein